MTINKCKFYRCQRSYVIGYYIVMCFFALCAIASLILPYYIYTEVGMSTLEDVLAILFSIVTIPGIFIGLMAFIKIKGGRRMKTIRRKFAQLPSGEKEKVNSDLNTKFRHVLWGEERLYIRATWAVEFILYSDIAWIYPSNVLMPMVAAVGDVVMESYHNILSLHIYDTEGMRYKIHTQSQYETAGIVEGIKEKAPDVIYGYTKKRAKLAKKDFGRFLHEEKNIYADSK